MSNKTAMLVNTCGSAVVCEDIKKLVSDLHEMLARCTTRLQPILREEPSAEGPAWDRPEIVSELFRELADHINDCRCMVRDYHSVIDRIDL